METNGRNEYISCCVMMDDPPCRNKTSTGLLSLDSMSNSISVLSSVFYSQTDQTHQTNFFCFLGATKHLYKRVCPSVHLSVHRSVQPSVRPPVRPQVHNAFSLAAEKGVSQHLMPCIRPCLIPTETLKSSVISCTVICNYGNPPISDKYCQSLEINFFLIQLQSVKGQNSVHGRCTSHGTAKRFHIFHLIITKPELLFWLKLFFMT